MGQIGLIFIILIIFGGILVLLGWILIRFGQVYKSIQNERNMQADEQWALDQLSSFSEEELQTLNHKLNHGS